MRKHATMAYEMLQPIGYLRTALDIPYCHHEKWDGTGYPRGLKGEEIPLVGADIRGGGCVGCAQLRPDLPASLAGGTGAGLSARAIWDAFRPAGFESVHRIRGC